MNTLEDTTELEVLLKDKLLSLPLTDREREVFAELVTGATNSEISNKLIISIHTVKAHISNILKKFDAANRTNAVAKGLYKVLNISFYQDLKTTNMISYILRVIRNFK